MTRRSPRDAASLPADGLGPQEEDRTSPRAYVRRPGVARDDGSGAPARATHGTGRIVRPMTCDSCGADAEELYPVHRKYVTVESWDQEPSERVLDDVERWCFACLTHYPHEPA